MHTQITSGRANHRAGYLLVSFVAVYLGVSATAVQAEVIGGTSIIYDYIYPPPPQQGPPERKCFKFKRLDADVNTIKDIVVEDPVLEFIVPPNPTPGGTPTPTIWMIPTVNRTGTLESPNDDQGDLQLDNSLTEAITAFAIAIPAPLLNQQLVTFADRVYTGKFADAWQSGIVLREHWDANVWNDLSIGHPGNPADDIPPHPAPSDWTPAATGGVGLRFEDVFGNDPSLGAVAIFWTTSQAHALAPGETMIGFHLGATDLAISSLALPFVTFGDGTIHQPGIIQAVPELSTGTVISLVLAGLGLWKVRGIRRRA